MDFIPFFIGEPGQVHLRSKDRIGKEDHRDRAALGNRFLPRPRKILHDLIRRGLQRHCFAITTDGRQREACNNRDDDQDHQHLDERKGA